MFIGRRESTTESESSDENVVSFRRKVRNRISSCSGSDTDESYASEDIEELLEELVLDEEEKLNTANDSLDNIQWIYNFSLPRSTMSRNRFELLLSNLHFANNETIVQNNKLGKVLPLVDILMVNYQKVFSPGKEIVVDETMVPWRGRLGVLGLFQRISCDIV
ncbi:PREDICTED: uncharacterized protein LOC108550097 [Eufriesea mexicana]|uniref:uncharacterized protein LOC108550097 n=1 Tax=Eufriesea mexicana TaxID=516756 RepID=UPI00083C3048|nr:PREDICTED: uncharacterized protein LOC108550097 [Eufriesea mexicana]